MTDSISQLSIPGSFNINRTPFVDERGYFFPSFRAQTAPVFLKSMLIKNVYISHNTKAFTLRGFHRQIPPFEENKLITCMTGSIFHVLVTTQNGVYKVATNLVDSRKHNSTFVPGECYSAFLTLEDNTKVQYLTDANYEPNHQDGIRWNSPSIRNLINWPCQPIVISERDQSLPSV